MIDTFGWITVGGRGLVRGCDEVFQFGWCEGAGEEVALSAVAGFALEAVELVGFLDAFGEGLDAESLAQLDEGVDECVGFGAGGDAVDEGSVDLERVDGELSQVAEG